LANFPCQQINCRHNEKLPTVVNGHLESSRVNRTDDRHGSSLSITITSNSQIRTITAAEAQHRLKAPGAGNTLTATDNRAILDGVRNTGRRRAAQVQRPTTASPRPPQSKNKAILDTIRPSPASTPSQSAWNPPPGPLPAPRKLPWGWIIFGAIVVFVLLRSFR
jgi:hypothetical protein